MNTMNQYKRVDNVNVACSVGILAFLAVVAYMKYGLGMWY